MTHIPILIPISLLLAAIIIPLVGMWRRTLAYAVALLGAAISLIAAITGLLTVLASGEMRYHLGGWPPPIGIEYVLDPLSALMAVLITFVGLLVLVYSRQSVLHEMPEKIVPFFSVAMLLLAGLAGIVVTGDLFNLFVFLEIASLAAYALMAIGDRRAPFAVFRYIILGTMAGSFYLLGVGFIYFTTGSLNMADVAQRLPEAYESRAVLAAAIFILIGLGLKMALFPLHVWLPDVYTYSPSAVAGLIPPLMTKVSAYALVRMLITVFGPVYLRDTLPFTTVIAWLSVAGIIVASVMTIAQTDLRRMLAYSSVSQIAYVGLGIGMANPLGIIAALLHILNHAFMKACLFLVAGAIRYRTGFWEIGKLGGLARQMPWTMIAFTIAALSMIGIPPLAGFFSKWYLVLGAVELGNWVFVAVILVSSLLTAVYFFRILEQIYMAAPLRSVASPATKDPPLGMLVPTLILAAGVVILGLANVLIVTRVLELVVVSLY